MVAFLFLRLGQVIVSERNARIARGQLGRKPLERTNGVIPALCVVLLHCGGIQRLRAAEPASVERSFARHHGDHCYDKKTPQVHAYSPTLLGADCSTL